MKKLALGFLGLVVLLIAGVLVAPSFIDWNAHKDRIAGEVRKATGRDVSIAGDVSLSLLPAPAFSAAGVTLANIEGGSHPAMVELEALKIRVAPMPLLGGEVQVQSVTLLKPVIRLDVLADGRANWDLSPSEQSDAAASPGGAFTAPVPGQIRLDRVTITDGTLIYRDAAAGREERIERLNAEIAADSLNGPFAVSGDAVVHGIASEFEVNTGRLLDEGAIPVNLGIRLSEAGAKAQFGGAVSLHGDQKSLRGQVKVEGDDLAALGATLTGETAPTPALAHTFAFEGEVSADLERVSATDLVIRIGDTAVEGDVLIDLRTPVDGQVRLAASRVNLDKLLAGPAEQTDAAPATPATPDTVTDTPGRETDSDGGAPAAGLGDINVALPKDISVALEVTVDALVYRGQVVRQILFSAALADGRITLTQALALLPGGSDVNLTGTLGMAAAEGREQLAFDGRVEAASDNFRAILDWLNVDVSTVPADRLRKMSLTANVSGTAQQATVSDVDLRFDVSRAMGGVAMILRERPGFGVGLAIDKLDLGAYLPKGASAADPEPSDGEVAEEEVAEETGTAETPPGLAGLDRFDANLDLRLGSLTYEGLSATDVHLDATLQEGAITVREAQIGDLAGTGLRASGTVADLTSRPSFDAAFSLNVADPARLARLAKQPGGTITRIGPFDLTGTVKGSTELVAFDSQMDALGGRFGAIGTARPMAVEPEFEVSLRAEYPSVAQVAGAIAPDLTVGPAFGGVDLSARVVGTPSRFDVSALAGTLGPLELSGSLAVTRDEAETAIDDLDMQVGLRHPDLADLARAISPAVAIAPRLGAVDLKAKLSGSSEALQIADLAGRLGGIDLSGSLGADLSGDRPALDLDLTTGPVPISALLAPAAGGDAASDTGTAAAARSAAGQSGAGRWSREPIDVSALKDIDATVALRSDALLYDDLRLDNAVLEAVLDGGVLDLRRLSGTAYDGALSVSGKVDARDGLQAGLAITAIEVNTAKLVGQLAETDRVAGPLNVNASLTSQGGSVAELIDALSGNGTVDGSLTVVTKAEEQVGNVLLNILGQKIREVRGVTDATNLLFNAFAGTPADLRGTFTIERGVARTSDLRLDGRQATALTQGTADLPAWRLDTRTDVFTAEDPNTPYITAELRGPLDEPNPRIKGDFLAPREETSPSTPDAATEPAEEVQPEDFLKQELQKGLQNLLKGFSN